MVKRVYVEKKPEYAVKALQLLAEAKDILLIEGLRGIRILNRYDVEGIDDELFETATQTVFSEPAVDVVYSSLEEAGINPESVIAVEYLPGQFDQRADSASECIQLVSQSVRPDVRSATLYALEGDVSAGDIERLKNHLINPVESREAALHVPLTLAQDYPEPEDVEVIDGFRKLDEAGLAKFLRERGLAMDVADLEFCRAYFEREGRDPSITEIKMIDTYWSDHCRHTTFGTILDDINLDDAPKAVKSAYDKYIDMRKELGRENRDLCMMDMGTIGAKWLVKNGFLKNLDVSDEINACTVRAKVDVNGQEEDWLYLFKNETHNHPTEIEPFGGAATCVGGAIRDPLSGRAYVYQAMRVTGAADPTAPIEATIPGKLPQRKIVTSAAEGYSSYGNQIGLATGQVDELYHPGYAAKRMEIGAVIGAAPARNIRREVPAPGDIVVLLGGRTGRDGIGGATGSSKAHDAGSLESCGAEVQKGNAPVERKIQRLFRREDAASIIKRCNDFGAGGVSVAIGELADGLRINLDAVSRKYDGLDGTELAISESQERMAVVLAPEDVDAFIALATEENLEATPVAEVTDDARVRIEWRGNAVVDLSREFLASNGAPKHQSVVIDKEVCGKAPGSFSQQFRSSKLPEAPMHETSVNEVFRQLVSDLNVASKKGLIERFDSTIGAGTVLMPLGGKTQLTPAQAMVSKLPVFGETTTVSGLAWGFNPFISSQNPFVGAYLAVVESVAKLVATGFSRENAYLTFQEYFEKLGIDPKRWGKPVSALLGALMAQVDLKVGAIGGKDSMSGSYEDLDVPPTLVSFATALGNIDNIVSPEFKGTGHKVILVSATNVREDGIPETDGLLEAMDFTESLIREEAVLAASTLGFGGIDETLFKMCVGNQLGLKVNELQANASYGAFVLELKDGANLSEHNDKISVVELGTTIPEYKFIIADEEINLAKLQETWESALHDVFPYKTSMRKAAGNEGVTSVAAEGEGMTEPPQRRKQSSELFSHARTGSGVPSPTAAYTGAHIARPRVIVPVFPGTNCEYDTKAAFEAAGAEVEVMIINNLTPQAVQDSTAKLVKHIQNSQIIMLPGGFSGGDEPDGSAKFIAAFFRAPAVTEAVRDLLQNRDGLMLGICNGFQALVKLGLLPYGDIMPAQECKATLTFNTIGRHQSGLVDTRVASTLSPWLSECKVGDIFTVAISHGEGRFMAPEELLDEMVANGQVATQYVDLEGNPTMNLLYNPNGSMLAIEGISSPGGRILGKMGHSERRGNGLYKNVPGNHFQPIFESGVKYFS